MGYYIQTSGNKGKAEYIAADHDGKLVSEEEAEVAMTDPTKGVVCVVDNGPFEAALFCYDQDEFDQTLNPDDPRPRQYVIIDREKAEELSGYAEAMKRQEAQRKDS